MGKFKASFEGYSNDLVMMVGMSMNACVRKICEEQSCKPAKSSFLVPETANPEWLRNNIAWQVATAIFAKPTEKRNVNELHRKVLEVYADVIEEWIQENKANLAEIGFLFTPEDTVIQTQSPPVQHFAPAAAPAALPPGINAIVCRRGRR